MKKYIILFICFEIFSLFGIKQSFAASGTIVLKPSPLSDQMQKNAILIKKNLRNEKIATAKALIEIRKKERLEILLKKKNTQKVNLTQAVSKKTIISGTSTVAASSTLSKVKNSDYNFQESIQNVDINKVRDTWLIWYNSTRTSIGLKAYTYDNRIDKTAHDWNLIFMEGKGQNHHRRSSSDSYYDFPVIDKWFSDRGINPTIINKTKHVENVGYGYYRCTSSDCTDTLIKSIRSTYDFFMSEKGKSYDAHYRSIIQPNFTKIGISILVNPNESRYYITIHYITE